MWKHNILQNLNTPKHAQSPRFHLNFDIRLPLESFTAAMQMNSGRLVANTLQTDEVQAMIDSNIRHGVKNCIVTNIEPALLAKVLQHIEISSETLLDFMIGSKLFFTDLFSITFTFVVQSLTWVL